MQGGELVEPFARMLADLFPPEELRRVDRGGGWDEARKTIEASGYLDALLPEAHGGPGLGWHEVIPLFFALGSHAAPLEIGEEMIDRAGPDPAQAGAARTLLRAAAMSGAADSLLSMTVDYAGQREQFGKPVARQQAVQQQLAVMAQDVVAMRMACELAGQSRGWPDTLATAVAKSLASSAAPRVAAIAHAIHGAIAISAECDVQLFTRRLHLWRSEYGSESYWNAEIGLSLVASGERPLDWVRHTLFSAAQS